MAAFKYRIDDFSYKANNGKAPRGAGNWTFVLKTRDAGELVVKTPEGMFYSDAVKEARRIGNEVNALSIWLQP